MTNGSRATYISRYWNHGITASWSWSLGGVEGCHEKELVNTTLSNRNTENIRGECRQLSILHDRKCDRTWQNVWCHIMFATTRLFPYQVSFQTVSTWNQKNINFVYDDDLASFALTRSFLALSCWAPSSITLLNSLQQPWFSIVSGKPKFDTTCDWFLMWVVDFDPFKDRVVMDNAWFMITLNALLIVDSIFSWSLRSLKAILLSRLTTLTTICLVNLLNETTASICINPLTSQDLRHTLQETNIAPENWWLEYNLPFGISSFQVPC